MQQPDQQPSPAPPRERVVRVFISSTFRDMQEERDRLVKYAFPELRRRCRQRQVDFVEVDLRWGVTEEQTERGELLPILLTEIDNCRPYFIGLLGERYGFIPAAIPDDLGKIYPWLTVQSGCSITELEILHGALNNPAHARHSYFYFRDPDYSTRIPVERRADFVSEGPAAREKLTALKNRIRQTTLPRREPYPDPDAAGQQILEDLWQAIDRDFPAGSEPEPLEQEAAEHETFAATRSRVYIGRSDYFTRLDRHVHSDDPPLVVTGESGSGKTALMANWAQRHRQSHPQDLLIMLFVGSTAQSADYVLVLKHIMQRAQRFYQLPVKIPERADRMQEEFPLLLAMAATRGRMVLILDGLDQLEDRENALELGWLPDYVPPPVRMIVSALPGKSLDALQKRAWPLFSVDCLNPDERQQVIREYLAQYRKNLSQQHLARIAAQPQAGNPLYLRALLDELRICGKHEQLEQCISNYLTASTVSALYEKMLERLEQDYGKERPRLVRDTMSLVCASRRGLYESELLELLGSSGSPLARAVWSPLYLALQESLVSRSGLYGFFHDHLHRAVQSHYLATAAEERSAHLRLADYFSTRELDGRTIDELPWQLAQAQELQRLKDCVADLAMFQQLMTAARQYELTGYWLALEPRFDLVATYQDALVHYEQTAVSRAEVACCCNRVASFLNLAARYEGAEPLYRKALAMREELLGPEHPDTAQTVNDLAELLERKGAYEAAAPLFRRALAIREKALGLEHPDTAASMNNLAALLAEKGDFASAQQLYRKALALREKVLGPQHPDTATTCMNLGGLLHQMGEYGAAETHYRRALSIREKTLGFEHPHTATTRNNLAGLLSVKGEFDEAEALYRKALAVTEKVLGPRHPDTAAALNNLAGVLYQKGDYSGTEALYRQALAIFEQAVGADHPHAAVSLNNLAGVLYHRGAYDEAEILYEKALNIREKVFGPDHPDIAASLDNLAALLSVRGDFEAAAPVYERALAIREKLLGPEHPDTARTLMHLGGLLHKTGDYDKAAHLYQRALAIREKVLGPEHPETATALVQLAGVLRQNEDYDSALPLYQRALAIREKLFGPEHLQTAEVLNNLAGLLAATGEYDRAELFYLRVVKIAELVLGPEHPNTIASRNNLARVLQKKGEHK